MAAAWQFADGAPEGLCPRPMLAPWLMNPGDALEVAEFTAHFSWGSRAGAAADSPQKVLQGPCGLFGIFSQVVEKSSASGGCGAAEGGSEVLV